MQGAKCLNIKNKAVVEDLNKLTSQLGSYEAAYYVLSENDGIMPDSTQLSAILGISKMSFKVGEKSTENTNPEILDFLINKIAQSGVDIEYLDSENFSFNVGDTVLVHGPEYSSAQKSAVTNHPSATDGKAYTTYTNKNHYRTVNIGGIPVFYTAESNEPSETITEGKNAPNEDTLTIIRKVNEAVKVMSNRNGVVYGFTVGNKIFLFKDRLNLDTPIHEYTHLWCRLVRKNNPELWNKIKKAVKNSGKFKEVKHYVTLEIIMPYIEGSYSKEVIESTEINVKYTGYIKKQLETAQKQKELESVKIPNLDYDKVPHLALEARQKLQKVQPSNIGQASRISGVNPSDISVLLIYLKQKNLY